MVLRLLGCWADERAPPVVQQSYPFAPCQRPIGLQIEPLTVGRSGMVYRAYDCLGDLGDVAVKVGIPSLESVLEMTRKSPC